jgi:hypothetical protein
MAYKRNNPGIVPETAGKYGQKEKFSKKVRASVGYLTVLSIFVSLIKLLWAYPKEKKSRSRK